MRQLGRVRNLRSTCSRAIARTCNRSCLRARTLLPADGNHRRLASATRCRADTDPDHRTPPDPEDESTLALLGMTVGQTSAVGVTLLNTFISVLTLDWLSDLYGPALLLDQLACSGEDLANAILFTSVTAAAIAGVWLRDWGLVPAAATGIVVPQVLAMPKDAAAATAAADDNEQLCAEQAGRDTSLPVPSPSVAQLGGVAAPSASISERNESVAFQSFLANASAMPADAAEAAVSDGLPVQSSALTQFFTQQQIWLPYVVLSAAVLTNRHASGFMAGAVPQASSADTIVDARQEDPKPAAKTKTKSSRTIAALERFGIVEPPPPPRPAAAAATSKAAMASNADQRSPENVNEHLEKPPQYTEAEWNEATVEAEELLEAQDNQVGRLDVTLQAGALEDLWREEGSISAAMSHALYTLERPPGDLGNGLRMLWSARRLDVPASELPRMQVSPSGSWAQLFAAQQWGAYQDAKDHKAPSDRTYQVLKTLLSHTTGFLSVCVLFEFCSGFLTDRFQGRLTDAVYLSQGLEIDGSDVAKTGMLGAVALGYYVLSLVKAAPAPLLTEELAALSARDSLDLRCLGVARGDDCATVARRWQRHAETVASAERLVRQQVQATNAMQTRLVALRSFLFTIIHTTPVVLYAYSNSCSAGLIYELSIAVALSYAGFAVYDRGLEMDSAYTLAQSEAQTRGGGAARDAPAAPRRTASGNAECEAIVSGFLDAIESNPVICKQIADRMPEGRTIVERVLANPEMRRALVKDVASLPQIVNMLGSEAASREAGAAARVMSIPEVVEMMRKRAKLGSGGPHGHGRP